MAVAFPFRLSALDDDVKRRLQRMQEDMNHGPESQLRPAHYGTAFNSTAHNSSSRHSIRSE